MEDAAEELSITLTPEMAEELRASVAAGEYASTSEALRDAVRIWQHKRRGAAEDLVAIRARIRRSLDDPRPDMTLVEEVDALLAAAFARAQQAGNATT
jgi:antitoxin ParD1/3/4